MKKRKIYFLKDGPVAWLEEITKNSDEFNYIFHNIVIDYNRSQKRLERIVSVHKEYVKLAFKTVSVVDKGDLIVCWLDLIGLYTYIGLRLFGKRNKILVLNLMVNNDSSFISTVKRLVYKYFLRSTNSYFTLTSEHLKELYFDYFPNCNRENLFVLNDCFEDLAYLSKSDVQSLSDNSIFCGGRNSRDWNVAFEIARLNPAYNFIYVVPDKSVVPKHVSKNVTVHENISKSKFNSLIANSALVILPLTTDAPAGLIVLYLSGLLKKALIISDSLSVRNYITHGKNGIIVKDTQIRNFSEAIRNIMEDDIYRNKLANSLNRSVMDVGSPESFYRELTSIIKSIL